MILCPNCGAKLPDRVQHCTFCQAGFDPAFAATTGPQTYGPAKWVVTAYYTVSGYFMVSGLMQAAEEGYHLANPGKDTFLPFSVVGIVFGILTVLFGLGLMLRIDFVRGIANFLCGIKIILGLISAPAMVVFCLALGPIGALLLIFRALDLAVAAFMIYLIGETDRLGVR